MGMTRHSRKFKPRQRTKRTLGESITSNSAPKIPHESPTAHESGWNIKPPLSSRLYQKSGLGVLAPDESIILSPMEVLFCNWHRHVPLPDEHWFEKELAKDPDLLAKAVIFDNARSGGELVIPCTNVPKIVSEDSSFAFKWKRNKSHFNSDPVSQIRWFWTFDELNWEELTKWANAVQLAGYNSDIYVIDDEMEVTMYRISFVEPVGNQKIWSTLNETEIETIQQSWNSRVKTESGTYMQYSGEWPLPSIGVEHLSGINLRVEESLWLRNKIENLEHSEEIRLFDNLINRGLILRPGFKFGSKWRVYDDELSLSHAPWLIQTKFEVARTWENVCLSVRLAEGVHKKWVYALNDDDGWKFVQLERWSPGRD